MKYIKIRHRILALILTASLCVSGASGIGGFNKAYAASGSTYYVDGQTGDNANDGTENSPFQTIQHAVNVANPGDTVLIREGVYSEEVKFNGKQGTADAPITVKNYPEEEVVISGCDPLTGWTEDENRPGEGIYKTKMDWSLGKNGDKNQLFSDGEMMFEARYPNVQDGSTMTNFNYAKTGMGTGYVAGTNKQKSQLVDSAFKEFAKTADFFDGAKIWMVPGAEWTALTSEAESYDPVTGTVVFPSTERALASAAGYYDPKAGKPYFIFGTYSLLDDEKEWWYDQENGEVYVKISNGKNPDDAGVYVEAKARENALDLSDSAYVNIEGIQTRGAALITNENSSHILLKKIKGDYVGHCSMTSGSTSQDDLGVFIEGSFIEINSCEFSNCSGPVINIRGTDNRLINSYIHDGDYLGTYAGNAKISGRRQFISNNTICESGRDVLSFRGLAESVIQYNDIYGAGRLTKDLGIMYTAGTDGQNTMIHHNYLHDNYTKANPVGLYLDEMSHNFIEFNNVAYNTGYAFQANQPSMYNLLYNNTGYNSNSFAGSYNASFADSRGRQIMNNMLNSSDSGSYSPGSSYSLANVNETNMFMDLNAHDFRLKEESRGYESGVPVLGVTPEGVLHPSAGAYQPGEEIFKAGHDFENEPVIRQAPDITKFEYRNLVKNGGFEYGTLEGWNGSARVENDSAWHATTKIAATGDYGAVLESGDKISQTIPVEPYTRYTIGLLARAAQATGNITISAGDDVLNEKVSAGNWSASKSKILDITTGNVDEITVTIENAGSTVFYIDDIGMQKYVNEIGELSSAVILTPTDEGCTVSFENLPEGHQYFYSDIRTKEENISVGDLQIQKPEEYDQELKNGMSIPWCMGEYLNVVETVGDTVVGFGSIQKVGETETIQREAVNDGFIRGGSYADIVQNTGNDLYKINLNKSSDASYSRNGYMQFDVSDIDPEQIVSAKLKFYICETNSDEDAAGGAGQKRGIIVSGVAGEEWDEDTLTWNEALGGSQSLVPMKELGKIDNIYKIEAPDGKYCELDITDYIQEKSAKGTKATVELKIDGIYPKCNIFIATKENPEYTDMKYHPQLEIECRNVVKKEVNVVNDGFIRGGANANNVQNSGNDLYKIDLNKSNDTSYSRNGYMQFDLSELDADSIAKAKLKFYIYETNSGEAAAEGAGQKRGIIVSGVAGEEWDEDTLTWNGALGGSKPLAPVKELGRINDIYKVAAPNGKYCELDITDYIKEKAANGTKATVELEIDGIYPKCNIYIVTKENPDYPEIKYQPHLEVEYHELNVETTGVELNKTNVALCVDEEVKLQAKVKPIDATNKNVRWSTSDDKVAVVDESGNVTAVGVGEAVITVTTEEGHYQAECIVRVNKEYVVTIGDKEFARGAYNTKVTVTAPRAAEGQIFAGWMADGKIVSFDETYTFYLAGNVTLIPAYTEKEVKAEAAALLVNKKTALREDGKSDVRFVGQLVLPEGCTIKNAGLVWSSNETTELVLGGNAKTTYISKISNTNQFSVTIKGMPQGKYICGKIFATIVDAEGNEKVVYSEMGRADAK